MASIVAATDGKVLLLWYMGGNEVSYVAEAEIFT